MVKDEYPLFSAVVGADMRCFLCLASFAWDTNLAPYLMACKGDLDSSMPTAGPCAVILAVVMGEFSSTLGACLLLQFYVRTGFTFEQVHF